MVDPIDYLIRRKFPGYKALQFGGSGIPFESRQKALQKIDSLNKELNAMPKEELQTLLKTEKEKERQELKTKLELEEKQRFFNRPDAKADFSHWSKASYWTLDEAVALSFGKAPETVSWDQVNIFTKISSFANQYAKTRDLVLRARTMQQLSDPIIPGVFLAWAKRNDISYSVELEEMLVARGQQIADWKTGYDQIKAQFDTHTKTTEKHLDEKDGLIDKLTAEHDQLLVRLAELEELTDSSPEKEKPLLTKERESVLKLIIGMAIKGYNYNPNAARNEATKEIADDLAKLGIALDTDTVRKWVKEGVDILPPDNLKESD